MSFNVGKNVGPYRIIEQLGQGGMAAVYKAYHAALDRYVALKVLHAAFGEDPNFEARFQREARLVAKLDHPNIVPVYDYAEHDGQPYLVMKFIEGETLKARMSRGPLSSEELKRVVESVGAGLAYAHKAGILHRDIKPSNVLLSTEGTIYLADFGLARIAAAGESTLSSDMVMGTPQYISPEQAMGKSDLDAGTDIYSFGVMLYEMVVGQVPFNADTPFSIIHDHIYTPLPLPHTVNPNVPEPVERVLLKALAKNRADRYAAVPDLVTAFLQAWQASGAPAPGSAVMAAANAPTVAGATEKPKSKTSPWLIASGAVIVFLCVAFVGLAYLRGRGLRLFPNQTRAGLVASRTAHSKTALPLDQATSTALVNPMPTLAGPTPSAAVLQAQQVVQQEPNDPRALLQLSLAYWDNSQPRTAYENLNKAANLAQPTDRAFFLDAARQFTRREAWIAVSLMYIRVVKSLPTGPIPPDVEAPIHEAIYKASAQPEMPNFVPFSRIVSPAYGRDPLMAMIAQGRYLLYQGNITQAKEFLKQARNLNPNLPEGNLLDAEIKLKEGQADDAQQTLNLLSSDPGTPDWIRKLADTYLTQIQ